MTDAEAIDKLLPITDDRISLAMRKAIIRSVLRKVRNGNADVRSV